MAITFHHEAPGDPTLLSWIKDRLNQVIDLDPSVMVTALGIVILLIPVFTLAVYYRGRSRAKSHM
jgi:hypothetical protein